MATNNSCNFEITNATSIYINAYTGSDTPGVANGSIYKPYASLSYALSQITDNSASKIYTIYFLSDITDGVTISIKPNINWFGNNFNLTCSSFTLDASWGTEDQKFSMSNLRFINSGTSTLDFSGLSTSFHYDLFWSDIQKDDTQEIIIHGPPGTNQNALHVWFSNIVDSKDLFGAGGKFTFIGMVRADLQSCRFYNVEHNVPNDIAGYSARFTMISGAIENQLRITSDAGSSAQLFVEMTGVNRFSIFGPSTTTIDNQGSCTMIIDVDVCSWIDPTITAGSPIISYNSLGSKVGSNLSVTNYTPTTNPVTGITAKTVDNYLKGIDNKFGDLPSSKLPGYIYGFPTIYGPGATQLQIPTNTNMALVSSDHSSDIIPTNTTLQLDNTVSGAGGIDTGTVAVNTRYFIFVIWDSSGSNPNTTLMSTSSTPSMPAGYDKFRCVATWKTKIGSTDFLQQIQNGNGSYRSYYITDVSTESLVLSGGSATTLTEVTLVPFISTLALPSSGMFQYFFAATAMGDSFYINAHGVTNLLTKITNQVAATSINGQVVFAPDLVNNSIDYKVDNALDTLDLYVSSFTEYV